MASYLEFAMMCHSYNFISIRRFINMCPLPLFCFNDSRKCELKIVEETQKTQIETKITQKKNRKNNKEKIFNFKTQYYFLEFACKHRIRNSCDLSNSCLITLSTIRP